MKNAAQLSEGESAIIEQIQDGPAQLKLMEMGCVPDEKITLLRKAAFGGPVAVEVKNYLLSMRLSEAEMILLRP
ncbi:MAG: ferrous iron transport protein A [Taibaiella sp.]|nr:ferrous iron transport protein A [Taibaiella sp.]